MAKREKGRRRLDLEETVNETMGDLFEAAGVQLPEKPLPSPEKPGEKRERDVSTASVGIKGKLVLRRERKGRKGKTVTLVEGLGDDKAHLERMAKDLRRSLGCGSHVEGNVIVLQGDQTDRAGDWFRKKGVRNIALGH